jgi:hypothetical protein
MVFALMSKKSQEWLARSITSFGSVHVSDLDGDRVE